MRIDCWTCGAESGWCQGGAEHPNEATFPPTRARKAGGKVSGCSSDLPHAKHVASVNVARSSAFACLMLPLQLFADNRGAVSSLGSAIAVMKPVRLVHAHKLSGRLQNQVLVRYSLCHWSIAASAHDIVNGKPPSELQLPLTI